MGYKITDHREITSTTPGGHAVVRHQLFITTDHGSTGILEVTPKEWSKDILPELIAKKVEDLDLAFNL